MAKTWITLKIKELDGQSTQLFSTLDDWILIAVQIENEVAQEVASKLRTYVEEKILKADQSNFVIDYLDLSDRIELIQFQSETALSKIQANEIPMDLLSTRFKINDLESLYKDILYYSFDQYLDGQTFIHLIVLNLKENRVPIAMRYFDFSAFNSLVRRFKVNPIGHQVESLYTHRDETQVQIQRDFLDWRVVLTMMILLQTRFGDSTEEIDVYHQELRVAAGEKDEISL